MAEETVQSQPTTERITYATATEKDRNRTVQMASHWLTEATGNRMAHSVAQELVERHIPGEYVLGPASTARLLRTIAQNENIRISEDYIQNQINDGVRFRERINGYMAERNAARIGGDNHLPKEVMLAIRPYIKQARRLEMDTKFRERASRSPQEAVLATQRMNQLLAYLNDNRIAFTLNVDGRDPSKIVASLEEYDNMIVDVFSADPREIGRVNTYKNIYSIDKQQGPGQPLDENAALRHRPYEVLDTLLNPGATVTGIVNTKVNEKSGKTNTTKLTRPSTNLQIFVSNIKDATTPVKNRIIQLQSYQAASRSMVDFNDFDETTTNATEYDDEQPDPLNEDNSEESSNIKKPKRLDMLNARYNATFTPAAADDPIANKIADNLARLGVATQEINVNAEGVYQYAFVNPHNHTEEQLATGQVVVERAVIGGIRELDPDGTYPLIHDGETYGTFVPGLRGYIDTRTGELRVKSFSEIFDERLRQVMSDQMVNIGYRNSAEAYTAFDNLYNAGAYGVTIQKGINTPEIEDVLIKTLLKRVRMPSELIDAATTGNDEKPSNAKFINKVDEFMQSKSLRVIQEEMYSVVDPLVTSIGKNQGGVLYLGSETTVDRHGRLIPGEGVTHAVSDVRKLPFFDEANEHDPIDRIIMSTTQLLRNVPVVKANIALMEFGGHDVNDPFIVSKAYAEKVHVAGHDGKNRSLKIGDKITDFHGNKGLVTIVVDPDEPNVKWPDNIEDIQWGISPDGLTQEQYNYLRTINPDLPESSLFQKDLPAEMFDANALSNLKQRIREMVVDPEMIDTSIVKLKVLNPDDLSFSDQDYSAIKETAELNGLTATEKAYFNSADFYDRNYIREREIFAANRDLEVVVAPFSLLSRANMGLPVEMRKNPRGNLNDVNLPDGSSIELNNVSMGEITMMISDMDVDYKTSIYDEKSYEKGKGRKLSHQLIMGMQAAGMTETLKHVFQDKQMNAEGWGQAIDDMRMMGFDIDKDGKTGRMDMGAIYERLDNNDQTIGIIQPNGKLSFKDQLEYVTKVQGAKDVFLALPVPVTLRSDIQTQLLRVPTAQFEAAERLAEITADTGLAGSHGSYFMNQFERIFDAARGKNAVMDVPAQVAALDDAIVAREFSKDKNVFKTKVYNARLPQSATAPMTNRPTGKLDTIYVSPEIADTLKVDPEIGPYALVWRDPILDTGGFVSMKVEVDETLTGCAIHYANDEAMKADRDGDSLAIWYEPNESVQREWEEKASREWRLGDPLRNPENFKSALTQGLNLDAGLALLGNEGKALKAEFNDPKTSLSRLQEIYEVATRTNNGFGSYGLDVSSNETIINGLNKVIDSGAKGSKSSLGMVNHFLNGDQRSQEQIDRDNRDWMYALGGKVDFVGPAGAIQQRLVKYLRNNDIEAAMFVSAQPTQGALQVKHDPEKARIIGNLLRKDLPNIFDGIDRHTPRGAQDLKRLNKHEFAQQLHDTLNKEMGVGIESNMITRLADSISDANGMIMTRAELESKADALDIAAYGGITDFHNAVRQNMSFGNGHNSFMFKPPVELAADSVLDKYQHQQLPNREYGKTQDQLLMETGTLRQYRRQQKQQKSQDKQQQKLAALGLPTDNIYQKNLQSRFMTPDAAPAEVQPFNIPKAATPDYSEAPEEQNVGAFGGYYGYQAPEEQPTQSNQPQDFDMGM